MSNFRWRGVDEIADAPVTEQHPLPVQVPTDYPIRVQGKQYMVGPLQVPGVGTGAAYADLDAFGGKIALHGLPEVGWLTNGIFHDLDDEGIVKELYLFSADFTATADNSAFSLSDADNLNCVAVLTFSVAKDAANNQLLLWKGEPVRYYAPGGRLWGQFQTRGADNIAAGNIPWFRLFIEE